MANLTSNQESFIDRMTQDEEHAFRGFELLLQRDDLDAFFDALRTAGLLGADKNRGPEPADQPNYFRIPYWPALDYLVAVAKKAEQKHDLALAAKIIEVVTAASMQMDSEGKPIDNYHTYRQFAEVMAQLPLDSVTDAFVDLVPIWLSGRFDTGLVGSELAAKVLPRFLASDTQGMLGKACRILNFCTRVRWVDQQFGETKRKEPVTVLEDYWLGELIEKTSVEFGRRAGRQALDAVRPNLLEVFQDQSRAKMTWLWRPAVEDHDQNRSGREAENRLVDAFRNILLAWIDEDVEPAKPYVAEMIENGPEMLRRIGIYCLDARFELLRNLVPAALPVAFLDSNLLHESYNFLDAHFAGLTDPEKDVVLGALQNIKIDEGLDEPDKRLKTIQRRWLLAMKGKGNVAVDEWFNQLSNDLGYAPGEEDPHPNFRSYMETHWGFGKSPFTSAQLIDAARQGTFVEMVNGFSESRDFFRGPTVRGLIDSIEEAVATEPKLFIGKLSSYDAAKPKYKYAFINGAKKLWEKSNTAPDDLDWNFLWRCLLEYLDTLTANDAFWSAPDEPSDGTTPDRSWITALIADFLRAGTNQDTHSYQAELLPIGARILERILQHAETVDSAEQSDPMTHAINTEKGRIIEALVSHTLRACRVADQGGGGHAEVWESLRGSYDRELAATGRGNLDFSTLMGAYVENLRYISPQWVNDNFAKLFPVQQPIALRCALEGLSHAPVSKPLYTQLRDHGVLAYAIESLDDAHHARENLVQRIGLAYIWKIESLEGPIFGRIMEAQYEDDAETVAKWFWSLRRSDVNDEQVGLILDFWKWCLGWVSREPKSTSHVMSTLGLLACYIDDLDDSTFDMLMAVAPRMRDQHHENIFTKELARLVQASPQRVGQILCEMLKGFTPTFDFEDALKNVVTGVAVADRPLALELADKLRKIRGFLALYDELAHAP